LMILSPLSGIGLISRLHLQPLIAQLRLSLLNNYLDFIIIVSRAITMTDILASPRRIVTIVIIVQRRSQRADRDVGLVLGLRG
jgi:hypothetical protein